MFLYYYVNFSSLYILISSKYWNSPFSIPFKILLVFSIYISIWILNNFVIFSFPPTVLFLVEITLKFCWFAKKLTCQQFWVFPYKNMVDLTIIFVWVNFKSFKNMSCISLLRLFVSITYFLKFLNFYVIIIFNQK